MATVYDAKLDRLYMKKIKCPYCGYKIGSMQTTCDQCGLSKMQIARASNKTAKQMMRDGDGGKIVMIKRRPDDVSFGKLSAWLLLGIFGAHCFYVGRRLRGWIMFGLMMAFIICVFIFPTGIWREATPEYEDDDGVVTPATAAHFEGRHSWRSACDELSWPFPTDFFGAAALIMWAMDSFAIVLGFWKYPVRLGDAK